VREILAPRSAPERKMVQFVDRPPSPGTEEGVEYAELKVVMKRVYVWDSFRDFVTVTSVTGFEEYIPQPRSMGGPETERLRTKIRTVDTKSDLPTTSDLKTSENLKVETDPPSTSTVSEIKVTQPGPPPAASSPAPIQEPKPTETSPPKPSTSTLSPQVVLPPVLPTFPAAADMTDNKATMQSTPVIKHGKVASRQTNIPTTEAPAPTVYPGKKFPVDHLKSIKPAQGVENTWDLRSAPLVKVDMEKSSDRRGDQDEFLLGLDDSKKVEEKTTSKKVVVVEEAKEVKEDLESQPVAARPISPPTIPTVIEEPAQSAPTLAALLVDASNPVSQVSTAPAVVETVKPSLPSSPPTRNGMPIPVPAVAVAKPALKSPKKPAIAPKPPGLSKPAKKAAIISPLVGGLVDPFLAALQPEQKRQTPTRPKTPSVSSDSANTTPEKSEIATVAEKSIKIEAPTPTAVKELSCPTSLSSSWTLVEKAKKEFAGLPTQPSARKSWFGVPTSMITSTPAATPAPTPTTTPILQPSRPSLPPATSSTPTIVTDPSTSKPTSTQGRKLFTFELKVGQSTVTTPVHENDDPRGVAETFAREHDLEARLPGGRGTVEKIVQYFEAQFIERKEQREKRRAERREKLIKQQQQQGANEEKSLV